MCNVNHPKFSCKICAKNVQEKDKDVPQWHQGAGLIWKNR